MFLFFTVVMILFGYLYGSVNYGQYLEKGFRTPSGKVELYSDTMAALGYDPLSECYVFTKFF